MRWYISHQRVTQNLAKPSHSWLTCAVSKKSQDYTCCTMYQTAVGKTRLQPHLYQEFLVALCPALFQEQSFQELRHL